MSTGAEQVTKERVFSSVDWDHSKLSECQQLLILAAVNRP